MVFFLTSPAFADGGAIPSRHARRGDNLSPFLEWRDPPPGTRSYVMTMEDADASAEAFRHWLVYDIPADRRQLAEGRSSKANTEDLPHAFNDFGYQRYDGPDLEPGDGAHTYRFRLAALGVESLGLPEGADATQVWEAARNVLVGEAEVTGIFTGDSSTPDS